MADTIYMCPTCGAPTSSSVRRADSDSRARKLVEAQHEDIERFERRCAELEAATVHHEAWRREAEAVLRAVAQRRAVDRDEVLRLLGLPVVDPAVLLLVVHEIGEAAPTRTGLIVAVDAIAERLDVPLESVRAAAVGAYRSGHLRSVHGGWCLTPSGRERHGLPASRWGADRCPQCNGCGEHNGHEGITCELCGGTGVRPGRGGDDAR